MSKAHKFPDPKDTSPMVEFYMPRQQYMDPGKPYAVTVEVNGYKYYAKFGETNRLPEDVVKVLKNAQTAVHPMKNARNVEIARGGEGRPQSELMDVESEIRYVKDFDIVNEQVVGKEV